MKQRLLAILLALILVFAVVACTDNAGTPSNTDETDPITGDDGTTSSTVDTPSLYTDNLPERDFNGHTFYVLTGVHGAATTHSFYYEESSDTLEAAYYRRNSVVADRFNVDFFEDDTGSCQQTQTLHANVQSGDESVDLYMLWDRFAFSASLEGLVYQITDLEYVNLDQPYWAQAINEELTFMNKQFFAVGDENPVLLSGCGVLFVNRGMLNDLKLSDPFELVRNGEWTYDALFSMAKTGSKSDGNDAVWDDNDIWGIVTNNNQFYNCLWMTNGDFIIEKDEEDIPYIAAADGTSFHDTFSKILELAHSEQGIVLDVNANSQALTKDYSAAADRYEKALYVFGNGGALFSACAVSRAGVLRYFNNIEYGVLPFPKVEEVAAGTPYNGTIGALVPYVVPSHISDATAERTGILLEALACAGKNYVNDVYYDIVLGQKEAGGDPDSLEMLDMLFNNRVIDLAEVYYASDTSFFVNCATKNEQFLTMLDSNRSLIEGSIRIGKLFIEQMIKNEGA
ncbi:MAG: hypothetical protein E7618_04610 [Ruminococcaceae bacterium]|nr:hypothetical protein [Oscillospiraceae bacterium]